MTQYQSMGKNVESAENYLLVNMDSFSDGQMRSKLWLCDKLERQNRFDRPVKIWIYGSWYGILALLLLVRQKIEIQEICLFDIDKEAIALSKKFLESWLIRDINISFYNLDCNTMNLETDLQGKRPDIVINTSCEHFENDNWIQQIPPGVMVIAQSTDMPHPTHNNGSKNLDDFRLRLALGEILDADRLYFLYENLSFFRFMIIGLKGQE